LDLLFENFSSQPAASSYSSASAGLSAAGAMSGVADGAVASGGGRSHDVLPVDLL
jgi:hypothetical protein